jgi:hypothetical protein
VPHARLPKEQVSLGVFFANSSIALFLTWVNQEKAADDASASLFRIFE